MQAMVEREAATVLCGTVQVDDASLGGGPAGGAVGRGSQNKVPFIGAVSLNDQGHPLRAKFTRLPGFIRTAIAAWAGANLAPTSTVVSDGPACFAGVTDSGCTHQPTVVGERQPKDLPMFHWVNTVLGNLKTSFSGAYHSFDFGKYAERYLGTIAYRFNRRFDLQALPTRLLVAAVTGAPRPEPWIRRMAELPC
jgi:hypothetical protein